jgi:hypothetical protein
MGSRSIAPRARDATLSAGPRDRTGQPGSQLNRVLRSSRVDELAAQVGRRQRWMTWLSGEDTRVAAFRGSCICGEIAFEVEGPFDLFLNCHCSRCRKATGTAHSCEVIVKAPALRWLRGERSVARFDLPQARSFATAFCRRCGSPMPHVTRRGREVIIPAGSFDEPLGAAPDRHVHWASRADWYVHGDGLLLQD